VVHAARRRQARRDEVSVCGHVGIPSLVLSAYQVALGVSEAGRAPRVTCTGGAWKGDPVVALRYLDTGMRLTGALVGKGS
jgi:hypothetical protein